MTVNIDTFSVFRPRPPIIVGPEYQNVIITFHCPAWQGDSPTVTQLIQVGSADSLKHKTQHLRVEKVDCVPG